MTTMERQTVTPAAPTLTVVTVDVVDGEGLDVAGEPVHALYRYADGSDSLTVTLTDAAGRARFADAHRGRPETVTVMSGPEIVGPLRVDGEVRTVIER